MSLKSIKSLERLITNTGALSGDKSFIRWASTQTFSLTWINVSQSLRIHAWRYLDRSIGTHRTGGLVTTDHGYLVAAKQAGGDHFGEGLERMWQRREEQVNIKNAEIIR